MNVPRRFLAPMLSLLAIAAVLFVGAPQAYADYSVSDVDITAEVASDGTLRVTETRHFCFYDDINGVYWTIPLNENQQGTKSTVDVQSVSVDGAKFKRAKSAESGQSGVYTVSTSTGDNEDMLKLKVYMPREEDDSADVTIAYELTGAVMRWADTGELYWKFVGDEWDVSSHDVRLAVSFDSALTAETPATKRTLRAWGHGTLTGEVDLDIENAQVNYVVPTVYSGEYAEARIAFPTAWIAGMAKMPSGSSKKRLSAIVAEEAKWANEANEQRESARRTGNILTAACVAVPAVLVGAFAFWRFRLCRTKPVFSEKYFRDIPCDAHPAALSVLMNRGWVGEEAFIAGLMRLTGKRVITIEKTYWQDTGNERDYAVTLTLDAYRQVTDKIDRAVLDLYFYGLSFNGRNRLQRTFKEFKHAPRLSHEGYDRQYQAYKDLLKDEYKQRWVAWRGTAGTLAGLLLAVIFEIANVIVLFEMDFATPNLIAFAAGSVLLWVVFQQGCKIRRLTQEGAEVEAKCLALKRWLKDFTRLKEAVPGDLVLWNDLLIMGVAMGVSRKVIRELADAVPVDVRDDDDFYDMYPGYWWYSPHGMLDDPFRMMHRAYSENLSELSGSSDSSGGGFGGGFSGGGGGGVGGGGGGTF